MWRQREREKEEIVATWPALWPTGWTWPLQRRGSWTREEEWVASSRACFFIVGEVTSSWPWLFRYNDRFSSLRVHTFWPHYCAYFLLSSIISSPNIWRYICPIKINFFSRFIAPPRTELSVGSTYSQQIDLLWSINDNLLLRGTKTISWNWHPRKAHSFRTRSRMNGPIVGPLCASASKIGHRSATIGGRSASNRFNTITH